MQYRTHAPGGAPVGAAHPAGRPVGRGARAAEPPFAAFQRQLALVWDSIQRRGAPQPASGRADGREGTPMNWRRALSLHRRLLAGDLGVIGEAARTATDTKPALFVLFLGMFTAAVGAWLFAVVDGGGADVGGFALRVLLLGTLVGGAGYLLWAAVTCYALQSIFQVPVDRRALLRALALVGGFAVWQFFLLAGPASFAIGLLTTVAAVLFAILAVRAAAPQADERAAVISVGIGFGVYALLLSLLASTAGIGAGAFVHAVG